MIFWPGMNRAGTDGGDRSTPHRRAFLFGENCSDPAVPIDSEPPDLSASPVLEALAADAVAAHATDSRTQGRSVHTHCENCGTALSGPYCHACGQHDIDFHRSFGHMFFDALENFFHFDAKLFRNIVTLLFRPGRLTAGFNAGQRAAQMPPLRLYIFVSVLFFFISFLGRGDFELFRTDTPAEAEKFQADAAGVLQEMANATPDPKARLRLAQAAEKLKARAATQEAATAGAKPAAGRTEPGVLDLSLNGKKHTELERYLIEKGRYAVEHRREMGAAFLHALPKMLLVCLPFFALFTRLLFRKSGQVYLQHLVLALHFHTFIFLWRLVADGWIFLFHGLSAKLAGLLTFGANLWLFLYVFLMLRHLFRNSWPRTIFKTFVLAGAYGLTLGLGFGATAIVIFLML